MRIPTPEENIQYIEDCKTLWRMYSNEQVERTAYLRMDGSLQRQVYWQIYTTEWLYLMNKGMSAVNAHWIIQDAQNMTIAEFEERRLKKLDTDRNDTM